MSCPWVELIQAISDSKGHILGHISLNKQQNTRANAKITINKLLILIKNIKNSRKNLVTYWIRTVDPKDYYVPIQHYQYNHEALTAYMGCVSRRSSCQEFAATDWQCC